MGEDKRTVGKYEIKHGIRLGDKEIVFGASQEREIEFFVADASINSFVEGYTNAIGGGDFLEVMQEFIIRLGNQLQQVKDERKERGVSDIPLTKSNCKGNIANVDLDGKVLIIKPEVLRPEYMTADRQLVVATGGFGCSPDGRGRAVFCTNLYSGETAKWERNDILGIADTSKLPAWAQVKIATAQTQGKKQEVSR